MSRKTCRAIRAAAELHGAHCTIESGAKHYRVILTREDGSVVTDTYGTGRVDEYKVRGWVRQLIRNGSNTNFGAR